MNHDQPNRARGIVAAAHFYYIIVAFEFFYMVSPFAAYFYGIYAPGLDFIAASPMLSWLNTFYLPHIVIETDSAFINAHNAIGVVLFTGCSPHSSSASCRSTAASCASVPKWWAACTAISVIRSTWG